MFLMFRLGNIRNVGGTLHPLGEWDQPVTQLNLRACTWFEENVNDFRCRVGVGGVGSESSPAGMSNELPPSIVLLFLALETEHENDARHEGTVQCRTHEHRVDAAFLEEGEGTIFSSDLMGFRPITLGIMATIQPQLKKSGSDFATEH